MFHVSCTWPLVIGFFVVLATTYLLYVRWIRSYYPPGPWPLPIIGNLHLLSSSPHRNVLALSEKYGPVLTIWMGSVPVIFVSKFSLCTEALISKSKDFDGKRSLGYFMDTITHQNEALTTRGYDATAKLMRKMVINCFKHNVLTKDTISSIVTRQVQELLRRLSSAKGCPLDAHSSLKDMFFQVVARVAMSLDVDECYQWDNITQSMSIAAQRSARSNFFPTLRHFLGITKLVNSVKSSIDTFMENSLRRHEKTYREGNLRDLMDIMIKEIRDQEEMEGKPCSLTRTNICLLMLDLLGAGVEPVINTTLWCLLILLKRPNVQKKIQKELDALVLKKKAEGTITMFENGKPWIELTDKVDIPYLQAFLYECMRVSPAATFGLPCKTLKNTSLGGCSIPDGTKVFVNYYAINRNPELWERASELWPERFIDDEGKLDLAKVKKVITFGLGKRMCVGEALAKTELILLLSNLLLNFELSCLSVASLPKLDEGFMRISFMPKNFDIIYSERN